MRYATLAALFLLTACATTKTHEFDRRSVSEEQFQRDGAACEMEAKKFEAQAGWGAWNIHGKYNEMLETCMRSKGYLRKE